MMYASRKHVADTLDAAAAGMGTIIAPRFEIEKLINNAYADGIGWANLRRPVPTVMTFEGKRIDPDKLAALLAACWMLVDAKDANIQTQIQVDRTVAAAAHSFFA